MNDKATERRKKRVKRLKRMLVTLFIIMLLAPTVLCIYTLKQVQLINARLDELGGSLTDKINKVELAQLLMDDSGNFEGDDGPHYEYYADDYEVPADFKRVYLTFDDGPSIYTTKILDTLDTYGVKATFFVTGNKVALQHPEWYQEIVGRGDTIGMHTFSHVYSDVYASKDSFIQDLEKIQGFVKETTGVVPKYYRFPGGSSNTVSSTNMEELCKYIEDEGMEYYDWNVSSQDAQAVTLRSSEIVNNVIAGVKKVDGDCIVLMHDSADKYSTVEALPDIIEAILGMEKTIIRPIDDNTTPVQHRVVADTEEKE